MLRTLGYSLFLAVLSLCLVASAAGAETTVPLSDGGSVVLKHSTEFSAGTAVKYRSDASVDPTYGTCGKPTEFGGPFPSPFADQPFAVKTWWIATDSAQSDASGAIYILGRHYTSHSLHSFDPAIVKLTPTGAIDTTFGDGGVLVFPAPSGGLWTPEMHVFPDGHLLFWGEAMIETPPVVVIVSERNPDGTPTQTFGDQIINLDPDAEHEINSLDSFSVTPDGAITAVVSLFEPAKTETFNLQADLSPYTSPAGPPIPPSCEGTVTATAAKPSTPLSVKLGLKPPTRFKQFSSLAGTASGTDLDHVEVAVARAGAKVLGSGWRTASGSTSWTYKLRHKLPPGNYVVFARAIAANGAKSSLAIKHLTLKR